MNKKKIIKYVIIGVVGIYFLKFLYNGFFPSKREYEKKTDMEFTVNPYKTKISGTLGDYLEVVENSYTFIYPGYTDEPFEKMTYEIKLKLKVVKQYPERKFEKDKGVRIVYYDDPDLKLDILDKNGMPVNGIPQLSDQIDEKQLKGMLIKGEGEFIARFYNSIYQDAYKKDALKDTSKIKTFQISGELVASGYKMKENSRKTKQSTKTKECCANKYKYWK